MCALMTADSYEHIQGGTDTEHFAALLMSYLSPDIDDRPNSGEEGASKDWENYHTLGQLVTALKQTISTILSIQSKVLGSNAQPNDLNIALTDGVNLVACRYRNHATEQPPSL